MELHLDCLPTHPVQGGALRLAIQLDDQPLRTIDLAVADGGPAWGEGVLAGKRRAVVPLPTLTGREYTLRLVPLDEGVVLDRAWLQFSR